MKNPPSLNRRLALEDVAVAVVAGAVVAVVAVAAGAAAPSSTS